MRLQLDNIEWRTYNVSKMPQHNHRISGRSKRSGYRFNTKPQQKDGRMLRICTWKRATDMRPQEETTSKMAMGSLPLLVTVKVQVSGPSVTLTSPKSCTSLSNTASPSAGDSGRPTVSVATSSTTGALFAVREPQDNRLAARARVQNTIFMPAKLSTVVFKIKYNA